ncbi:MAG: DUF2931 family protein [Prevotella sp.]|nr:DUF2931 family protein [Prevotella sp.]
MKTYKYTPFTSRVKDCEVRIFKGSLHYEGEPEVEEPYIKGLNILSSKCNDGWGYVKNISIMTEEAWPMPDRLELRYVTTNDIRCYAIDTPLEKEHAEDLWEKQEQNFPDSPFQDYVVGTAPYGIIAVWLRGRERSVLLHSFVAEEKELDEVEDHFYGWRKGKNAYMPVSREQMEGLMRQFCYRYVTLEEHWDEKKYDWVEYDDEDPYYDNLYVDSVEDHRSDGSFNYLEGDMSQLEYHEAGMPERITVRWHACREEYLAHFWLDKKQFAKAFIKFFDLHPDSRVDILLRIDTKEQLYVMALRAEGETECIYLPWHYYQLVVFKDGLQHYKSPNYELEKGQWAWSWRKKE